MKHAAESSATCCQMACKLIGRACAGQLLGKINWRIPKGKNDFIERNTIQKFKQVCHLMLLLL